MQLLRLQSPFMSGSDVADWQRFLQAQGVFHGIVDGVFGPQTAQATRDYQSHAGLAADGVVSPNTVAQATADGLVVSGSAAPGAGGAVVSGTKPAVGNPAGMDAEANCGAFAAQIAAVGMQFVARYYSHGSSKNLMPPEAHTLSANGLQIVAVFEDGDRIDIFTPARGASDAAKALQLAEGIGQPAGSAIYFAVDFDPLHAQVAGPVTAYFQAVRQVFAAAPVAYAVGVYGSGLTCRAIRDSGLAKYTWLSGSTGFQESRAFRPQADLVQFAPSRTLFGGRLNIDDDVAQSADFGAFRLAQPSPGPRLT
jgi:peptidoglycan hydrolase-like protein with peptidoglycan-binding domain